METLTLSAPVQVSTGATNFRVWSLLLQRAHPERPALIVAIFREVDGTGAFIPLGGRAIECRYEGATAEALIISLNKANLSTLSLEARVVQKCQADGKLGAGAITGTPD
jgi:hypothetical protein